MSPLLCRRSSNCGDPTPAREAKSSGAKRCRGRYVAPAIADSADPAAQPVRHRLHGYNASMERVTSIADVRTFETRGGNVRYVVRDADGNEYTTFREGIGQAATALEGRRVRIEFHEEERGQYTNVYLDKVEPAPADDDDGATDTDPSEAAWRTAVDAAPWLVGESEPHEEVPPDELYDKLKPFKERVERDIEEDAD